MATNTQVTRTRRGFTLIELLVVIAIMVALASITLLFLPKRETRLASQGADQLQTFIASARSRALRDQAPRGVRLISDGTGFREVQLLEVPEAVAPNAALSVNFAAPTVVTFTGYSPANDGVQAGDLLEIIYGSGSVHKIVNVNGANLTLASPVPAAAVTTLTLNNNYRFIRQARPLMGEPTLQLPNTVLVKPNSALGSQNIPATNDIMFAPSGQVIAATGGRIVLWVTDDNGVSKPTLLAIYTRTGGIAAHPLGPAGSEYTFTQDGRSSGQ